MSLIILVRIKRELISKSQAKNTGLINWKLYTTIIYCDVNEQVFCDCFPCWSYEWYVVLKDFFWWCIELLNQLKWYSNFFSKSYNISENNWMNLYSNWLCLCMFHDSLLAIIWVAEHLPKSLKPPASCFEPNYAQGRYMNESSRYILNTQTWTAFLIWQDAFHTLSSHCKNNRNTWFCLPMGRMSSPLRSCLVVNEWKNWRIRKT